MAAGQERNRYQDSLQHGRRPRVEIDPKVRQVLSDSQVNAQLADLAELLKLTAQEQAWHPSSALHAVLNVLTGQHVEPSDDLRILSIELTPALIAEARGIHATLEDLARENNLDVYEVRDVAAARLTTQSI